MSSFDGIIFHSAQPEARQDSYVEFNNVDFVLAVGEGRSLMRNSVRINGDNKRWNCSISRTSIFR